MFKRKPKRVYVLGAGPAGLLAAHAAKAKGYKDVAVLSAEEGTSGVAKKSDLFGCQYLHESIPELTYVRDGRPVRYMVDGPSDGYRAKVYGDAWQGTVSTDEYGPEESHYAWNLRDAYDKLWAEWAPAISPVNLTPQSVRWLTSDRDNYVINSIPAPALCRDMENHKFLSQQVWAMGSTAPTTAYSAAAQGMPVVVPDFTVVCNGWRDTAWYRAATVFGYSTLEWPGGRKPPINGVAAVSKPLSTDCECWLGDRYLRVGRYGRWTKGVLVHTAYFDTLAALP